VESFYACSRRRIMKKLPKVFKERLREYVDLHDVDATGSDVRIKSAGKGRVL
jgi:hypothetical protein